MKEGEEYDINDRERKCRITGCSALEGRKREHWKLREGYIYTSRRIFGA
jgi:hypothetical protein